MEQVENVRLRRVLMAQLHQMITARRMTQVQAARWFHVSQCRISHLVNGQFNRFTIDALANMLAHAGVRVSVGFERMNDDPHASAVPSAVRADAPASGPYRHMAGSSAN